jgi:hypothetical protein
VPRSRRMKSIAALRHRSRSGWGSPRSMVAALSLHVPSSCCACHDSLMRPEMGSSSSHANLIARELAAILSISLATPRSQ